ncbi:MAG: hypothetical protein R6V23_05020 [Bacteroidales bacterium]
MKTKIFKQALLISIIALLVFPLDGIAKKKNPYHTKGTKEYEKVTSKLIGEWNIVSFAKKKDEKMGVIYDKATVEFKEFDEKGDNGEAIFRFYIPKSTVDQRIESWNKKESTLEVENYVVVAKMNYKIHKKGDLIYLENQDSYPEIEGSGEQIENFRATEITFITSQSAMEESGGVGNLIGAKVMQKASGTDFVPSIPTQVNYKNLEDNSADLVTIQKINFKLEK